MDEECKGRVNYKIMKIHIVTVGSPKLAYAKQGWEEYLKRLRHYHSVQTTHIPDKQNDAEHIRAAIGKAHAVALVIDGPQMTSHECAAFLEKRTIQATDVCFVIGGPDGLPQEIIHESHTKLSFSKLTFPHDLAMVVLVEALYRASTINAGQPYHR